jgi:putative aldouronate transport system permease protein
MKPISKYQEENDVKVKKNNSKKPFWKTLNDNKTLLLMCLPPIIFFVVFSYLPLPGVYIAFTNYNFRDGIFGSPFVGLKNFEFLIKSGQLWHLTKNTILYNLVFIVLGNVLQITIAIMLNEVKNKWFKKVTQTIMFLPYFISAVLIGAITFNILNYDTGALNTFIRHIGGEPLKIYSMAGVWPFIIVFCQMWQQTGYGSVVYFASICGIDSSMIEAAEVDGASSWQRIRYIIIPSLKPTFVILLLFALGGIMKGNFGLFWNLVGNNSQLFATTDIIETSVYRMMMSQNNFATSSAVGLYQSIFGFTLVMVSNWLVKHIDQDYALF